MPVAPEDLIAALPCWRGALEISPMPGGLSNASYKVVDSTGAYVARLGRDFPFHHVSRRREREASRAAHAAGLAPRVAHFGEGVLVLEFIEGRPLTAEDFRARLPEVAALIGRAHAEMGRRVRGEAGAFWAFHVIRDYLDALDQAGAPVEGARLAELADTLEAAQVPLPIVFGHHDLLPGNVIDDGRRLWLIDWEYAGFGTADVRSRQSRRQWRLRRRRGETPAALYFGRAPEAATLRAFAAMKVASALREALWAMVSEIHLRAPAPTTPPTPRDCLARFETARAAYLEYGR